MLLQTAQNPVYKRIGCESPPAKLPSPYEETIPLPHTNILKSCTNVAQICLHLWNDEQSFFFLQFSKQAINFLTNTKGESCSSIDISWSCLSYTQKDCKKHNFISFSFFFSKMTHLNQTSTTVTINCSWKYQC